MLPECIHSLDLAVAPRHGFRVLDRKVITPRANELYLGFNRKGMQRALAALDDGIEREITGRVERGVKARVVAWNGVNGWVAGYSRDGRQVGYGHITFQPRISAPDLLGFESEYVVGSAYQRRGIALAMKILLETYAASTVMDPHRGIGVLSTVRASDEEHAEASRRLLHRVGAVPISPQSDTYRRIIIRPEHAKHDRIPGVINLKSSDIEPRVNYGIIAS